MKNSKLSSAVIGFFVVLLGIGLLVGLYRSNGKQGVIDQSAQTTINSDVPVSGSTYTVKKGDTLWKLAALSLASGYDWKKIADYNKITNPNLIEEGQKIAIPPLESDTQPQAEVTVYVVKKGDSLWKISQGQLGDGFGWKRIAEYNNITNPELIEVGQEIKLPPNDYIGNEKSAKTYVVKKGDSLWKIATAEYGSGFKWVEIAKLNKITRADSIIPGNVLQLP